MRNKLVAFSIIPYLLIQPVAAERRIQRDRDSHIGKSASDIKLTEIATPISNKPIKLIVQYNAPTGAGMAKSAGANPLEIAVKKLGGKQEALFKPNVTSTGKGAAPAANQQTTPDISARLRTINQKFPKRAARGVVTDTPPGNSFLTAQVVELPAGTKSSVAISTLQKIPGVTSVYPAREYKLNQVKLLTSSLESVYGIQAIKAPEAWQTSSQGAGITVAINDTGIYLQHVALAPNLWKNPGEIAGNCIDDDANGFVDDVYGITSGGSALNQQSCTGSDGRAASATYIPQPMDCHGHGSHVAGTVAAVDNGTFGLSGVAPQAKIMALKGLDDEGYGSTIGLARNIVYATDNGADIINNSWGSGPLSLPDPVLTDAIRYAAAAGVVNVFAAGNESADMALANPANMEEVLAVGAVDRDGKLADFSNYGARIDVVAPGVDVNSSFPDTCATKEPHPIFGSIPVKSSDFTTLSGTSMATPHVSGAVALILAANPSLRVDEVRAIIRASADDLGAPGFDSQFGSGHLNVARAVKMATAGKPIPRLTIRSANPSIYQDKSGRYPTIKLMGVAISGRGSQVTLKEYSGKNAAIVAKNSRDIRNGILGSVNAGGRPSGRYILEVSSTTEIGTFHSTTMLELFAAAKILDSVNDLDIPEWRPTFKGAGAGWMASNRALSGEQQRDPAHVFRLIDRNGNNGGFREFGVPSMYSEPGAESNYSGYYVSPARLSLLTSNIWGGPLVAFNFFSEPFTGKASDVAVLKVIGGKPELPKVIGRELPWIYSLKAAEGGTGDRLVTFSRDIGFSTFENKVQALRAKGTEVFEPEDLEIEELLRSDKGTYLINGTLIQPQKKEAVEPIFSAREIKPDTSPQGGYLTSAVLYRLKADKSAPSKQVLMSDPARSIAELDSDYDMTCIASYSRKDFSDWDIRVVEHSTKVKLKIAQGENVGACKVPQAKFITYLSWDRSGVYLNGYDLRTGRSGKTLISDYVFYSSFVNTGDGQLAWIENYQEGTRLVEFDVAAFRASINRAAATPTALR
jgi:subtilisin family serine protease